MEGPRAKGLRVTVAKTAAVLVAGAVLLVGMSACGSDSDKDTSSTVPKGRLGKGTKKPDPNERMQAVLAHLAAIDRDDLVRSLTVARSVAEELRESEEAARLRVRIASDQAALE